MDRKIIEKKWQDYWYSSDIFKAVDFSEKPKFYGLVEFPYPSGEGLHIGHIKAYISLDIISRKRRMEGYNVLFPIGFDAFGLPTENYAIKTGIHPREVTDKNIEKFLGQIKAAGFSFDFSRMIDTTDVNYYKWTQFIFLKLYEKGLAYRSKAYVNFCPTCKVVLSNEESQGGICDRCGSEVIQQEKNVWFLRITRYADRLLKGLDNVDFTPRMKTEQINWIGASSGAYVDFKVKGENDKLTVFTTRPDTLFGVTFMVIAPEHPLIEKLKDKITNIKEVEEYKIKASHKTEFERVELQKDKTGVELKGIKGINPITGKEIPIFISDYVMITYGTGAIMAVPAHDSRDYEFAKKYNLPIIEVIKGGDITKEAYTDKEGGELVNSDFLNGLTAKDAKPAMIKYLLEHGIGRGTTNYKMKDWAFNRQRYWGEPIPMLFVDGHIVPVPYSALPVELPKVNNYKPTDNGESPLSAIKEFTDVKYNGKDAKRETDTMPQWAGSSWYYLRYCDPNNDKEFANYEKLKYWLPVDWYNGGMEHVTRHLLYSRFWNQFLYDEGLVPVEEPYAKRTAQGLVLGSDGEKMSKSKGNVINPLNVIDEYDADTLRCYTAFMGDYETAAPWNDLAVGGVKRFLDRIERLNDKVVEKDEYSKGLLYSVNNTIKGVSLDIESMKFNTAIAKLMMLVNDMYQAEEVTRKDFEALLLLLNPFAPHLAEELWHVNHKDTIQLATWPKYDEKALIKDEVLIVVSVNGKLRDKVSVELNMDQEELKKLVLNLDKIKPYITSEPKKIIIVPNKLVNIVI